MSDTHPIRRSLSEMPELAKPDLRREELFSIYEAAVREMFRLSQIQFECPDRLKIDTADARTFTVHLENLWLQCLDSAEPRIDVLERHLSALAVLIDQQQENVAKSSIVPTIKDDEYLRLLGEGTSVAHEHLAGDVWVIYAVDLPTVIKTVHVSELQELNISPDELRALAVSNLRRLLPDVQRYGEGPSYMLAAGGDYTAGVLLLDDIWEELRDLVEGDVVASVPSRDVLLFTGSSSSEGIRAVRQKAREIHEGGDHVISQTLFRRMSGKWQVFG